MEMNSRHTLAAHGESVRVLYEGGGVVEDHLWTGAAAVIRGNASVIDGSNGVIPPEKAVICRRRSAAGFCVAAQLPVGVPVQVIDPGDRNVSLVLLCGTPSSPVVAKSMCRSVGACRPRDVNQEACGNCCNNFYKKKK